MSVLSDNDILYELELGNLKIENFNRDRLQPSSYDVLLADMLIISSTKELFIFHSVGYFLRPLQFILGALEESITLPNNIRAIIDGKSSNGRRGLGIHITAGYIDPGWSGKLTLEMFNFSRVDIKLTVGMKIAQVSFEYLHTPAIHPYGSEVLGSKYQNATGVEGSK